MKTTSKKRAATTPKQNIICFGDSITAGNAFAEGERWTSHVARHLEEVAPGRFRVWNRGVGGSTTAAGLDRFADFVDLLPATVLIEFGLNDANVRDCRLSPRCGLAAFKENLAEIVALVRKGGGSPVLVVNHCVASPRPNHVQGNGKDYMENFQPFQAAIRSSAKRHALPLIDLERSMERGGVDLGELLGEDGLHLSVAGNAIYAQHILRGLIPLLGLAEPN